MPVSLYHVDAFTSHALAGNPAAVCPLDTWLDDDLLRAVAAENNLSETAYFAPEGECFRLRWFTRLCEVNLCGHATLATAFILMTIVDPRRESARFETRGGTLTVRREGTLFTMDFPALPPWKCETPPSELAAGLGADKIEVVLQLKDNYFVVYESEDIVRSIRPDFRLLEQLHPAGVAVTAPGTNVDFVSRYFAPSYGVPEDPVTGSTHCSLAPYWAQRLGKNTLHARQISERGGELWCESAGSRVVIKGHAVLTLTGSLLIG